MTIFHLGSAPDANTMDEQTVRKLIALLSGKSPDHEDVTTAIQKIVGNPNQLFSIGMMNVQYRGEMLAS